VSWFLDHIPEGVVTALVGILGFIGRRAINRLDQIESQKADKDDLATLLRQLEQHIEDDREQRREVSRKFDEFGETLADVRVSVGTIAGRLERP
jgi:chromosome segregation ATPase